MIAHFYRYHQTVIAEIVGELVEFDMEVDQRQELAQVIAETVVNHCLRVLLDHFPPATHAELVAVFKSGKEPRVLVDPQQLRSDIQEIVEKEIGKVKRDLVAEIRRAGKKK